jgi:hypothetical protein
MHISTPSCLHGLSDQILIIDVHPRLFLDKNGGFEQ